MTPVSSPVPSLVDRDALIYVAGHNGLVGSAIWRELTRAGFTKILGRSSRELDLRNRDAVFDFFAENKPKNVIIAAAKVGGIMANEKYPVDFISDNLQIQVNLLDASLASGVERLLFLGSSCIYPKMARQPIKEEYLLTGELEPTNDAYAIAKIAGILQVKSVRRQYGLPWISAMPTNLYGPGDNFSPQGSHVLPGLIRRYEDARLNMVSSVTNWGTGTPRREFLHVDDLASACIHLLDHYDADSHVNVGTGQDLSIRELAEIVAQEIGYAGRTLWDNSRPDGTPRKLLDVSKLNATGWSPRIKLREGIASTISWYRDNLQNLRV